MRSSIRYRINKIESKEAFLFRLKHHIFWSRYSGMSTMCFSYPSKDEILNFEDIDDSDMAPLELTILAIDYLLDDAYGSDLIYPLSIIRFNLSSNFYVANIDSFFKRVRALVIAYEFRYTYHEKDKGGALWSKKRNEENLSGMLKDCSDHYVCMAFHLLDNDDTFISLKQVEDIQNFYMKRRIGNYEYCSR